jgi:hypothetical protein
MARRKRIMQNSVAGALESYESIKLKIEPAFKLTDIEQVYFNRIVSSREGLTWDNNHIALGSQLAQTMVQVDQANRQISEQGLTLDGKANPAIQIKVALTNIVVGLNRLLGLSSSQKGLSTADQRRRNQNENKLRTQLTGLDSLLIPTRDTRFDDDLI